MLRVSWSSWGRVHLLLLAPLVLLPASSAKTWSQTGARLKVSHTDLTKGWALSWGGGVSSGYDALLLDEDRGWLLVGGRDHIYLLRPDSLELLAPTIYWPAVREDVERCRLAGKSPQADCANFVRLLQPINETHVYACGTGAFHPQCTHVHVGLSTQEPSFTLSPVVESGRGKCPFSPSEPFAAHLTGGDLYSGTSVDFMGANAGIFRTVARGGGRPYIRTEAYDQNWLNEPDFVSAFSIPDTHSADDDKVYFFFKERAVEAGQWDKRVHSRVARVCKNDVGGKRSLINRWTTFLKARLLCPVPGPSGVDTHFDELEDIFVLETKDPQNPTIYGVFSTSSSIFRGSAVCVYSMASIRAAFNGPFAHREGPDYRWVEYRGRIPYPRPGTCPSETYDVLHRSTTDFPDDLVSFMRQHQLMWEPVLPLGGRPLLTSVHGEDTFRRVVVDRVDAHDGPYDVLHLGTGEGKVLKAVSIMGRSGQMEQLLLEELTVFQSPSPILRMELSNKRQQLYVSGPLGVVQLGLQRCQLYGNSCAECCLAQDPYCSWDSQTCSRSFPTNQRRARRQDVRDGDPCRHCLATEDESLELKVLYGVEGNSTFLECSAHPQAELRWTFQNTEEQQRGGGGTRDGRELPLQGDEEHVLLVGRGLLLQHLQLSHSGVYTCTSHQRSFRQGLARYRVQVIASAALRPGQRLQQNHAPGSVLPGDRKSWPRPQQLPLSSRDEACEQLWQRQKRRQQKLRTLKQEEKKARVRRNNPPELGEDGGR